MHLVMLVRNCYALHLEGFYIFISDCYKIPCALVRVHTFCSFYTLKLQHSNTIIRFMKQSVKGFVTGVHTHTV